MCRFNLYACSIYKFCSQFFLSVVFNGKHITKLPLWIITAIRLKCTRKAEPFQQKQHVFIARFVLINAFALTRMDDVLSLGFWNEKWNLNGASPIESDLDSVAIDFYFSVRKRTFTWHIWYAQTERASEGDVSMWVRKRESAHFVAKIEAVLPST